jgi:hypothetical protein
MPTQPLSRREERTSDGRDAASSRRAPCKRKFASVTKIPRPSSRLAKLGGLGISFNICRRSALACEERRSVPGGLDTAKMTPQRKKNMPKTGEFDGHTA